jgi:carnitine monooxygenase subunit
VHGIHETNLPTPEMQAEPTNSLHGMRYYTHEWMEKEAERLWPKVWLLAGVEADLASPGDFLKFDIGHESFVVVRTEASGIKAFYNVCPHRAMQLVRDDFGSVRDFTCGFHSWKFDLDGNNKHVTDAHTFRPSVLCNNRDLTKVKCVAHAGLVFLTMNPDPMPIEEWLGPVSDQLAAFNIQRMIPIQHRQSIWHANWKNCIDAFAEVYHLHAVHPQSRGMIDHETTIDLYPHGMSRQYVPFGRASSHFGDSTSLNDGLKMMLRDSGIDPDTYEGDGTTARRDMQIAKRKRADRLGLDYSRLTDDALTDVVVMSLFPNVQISAHAEAVYIFRFLPDPDYPDRFIYDSIVMYQPADEVDGYAVPQWMGLPPEIDASGDIRPDIERTGFNEQPNLGELLNQDADLLPVVQRGLRSRGFRGPLWSEGEARLRHFHQELDLYVESSI